MQSVLVPSIFLGAILERDFLGTANQLAVESSHPSSLIGCLSVDSSNSESDDCSTLGD